MRPCKIQEIIITSNILSRSRYKGSIFLPRILCDDILKLQIRILQENCDKSLDRIIRNFLRVQKVALIIKLTTS